jgi:teichuronic acid biosynthesis glycosyltransferase TuaC
VKIVSISTVYPNPREPGLGLFVRARLTEIARLAEVTVVAPVPAIDYSNPMREWFHGWRTPTRRADGPAEALHPRWFFPPGGSPANVACLFARLLLCLLRLRRRFAFDVIDAHFAYPEGAAAALLSLVFRRPFTVTLRGSEPVFARSRWRAACIRFALRRASAVLAVSNELRRFAIEQGAAPKRVHTVSNGIDRALAHPRDRAACRARFGMRSGRLVVVSAGEMIEAKGHHLVIEAVRRLIEEGLCVDLYIAGGVARGGVPFESELKRQVEEDSLAESVHFSGWLDRKPLCELLSAADVFCLASYTEGWPNVVNEALACGTPVVATRVGAVPEMLPDERLGIAVPPMDQAALTEALRSALLRTWDRDRIAAWGGARGWDDVARDALQILTAAAAGTRAAQVRANASRETIGT